MKEGKHLEEKKRDFISVYAVSERILGELERVEANERGRANLAIFRRSVGKPLEEASGVWPFLFEHFPEDFLGTSGRATAEENAIYVMLQLYALAKQGTAKSVTINHDKNYSMGSSLRILRGEEQKAIDRRFSAMAAAQTYEEFVNHLRQMIKILKAKGNVSINFAKLAQDLYWYQRGYEKEICFAWAKEYFRKATEATNQEEKIND